jgi:hypothetical protein
VTLDSGSSPVRPAKKSNGYAGSIGDFAESSQETETAAQRRRCGRARKLQHPLVVSRRVRKPTSFALALGVALLVGGGVGCSSSPSSDPQSSSDRCTLHCEKTLRANCENDHVLVTTCVGQCHRLEVFAEVCGPSLDAYLTCLESLPVACVTGSSDFQISPYVGCRQQVTEFGTCNACVPTPSDDACDTCEIKNCCDEGEILSAEPTAPDWLYCLESCDPNVPTCSTACDDKYPLVRPKAEAVAACKAQSCAAEC